MVVTKFAPSVGLRKYIKCYYYLENNNDQWITDTYFADGCLEAVFSVGWDFYKDGIKEDWAKIIGQIIKPRSLKIAGKGQSFGIWFYPHTFSFFSDIELFQLNDRVLSWDLLFPNSMAEFVGNCLYEKQFDRLVKGMDDFLLTRISAHHEKPTDRLTEQSVQYLYQNKTSSSLKHLASRLQVSQRYIQKLFVTKIGVSQKQFIRILRFQDTLQKLSERQSSSLTTLAYENNFYDQSHFIREFKTFTGLRPSEFEAKNLPINRHFIAD